MTESAVRCSWTRRSLSMLYRLSCTLSCHWSVDAVTSRNGHVVSGHMTVTWSTELDRRYWVTSSTTIYSV